MQISAQSLNLQARFQSLVLITTPESRAYVTLSSLEAYQRPPAKVPRCTAALAKMCLGPTNYTTYYLSQMKTPPVCSLLLFSSPLLISSAFSSWLFHTIAHVFTVYVASDAWRTRSLIILVLNSSKPLNTFNSFVQSDFARKILLPENGMGDVYFSSVRHLPKCTHSGASAQSWCFVRHFWRWADTATIVEPSW